MTVCFAFVWRKNEQKWRQRKNDVRNDNEKGIVSDDHGPKHDFLFKIVLSFQKWPERRLGKRSKWKERRGIVKKMEREGGNRRKDEDRRKTEEKTKIIAMERKERGKKLKRGKVVEREGKTKIKE